MLETNGQLWINQKSIVRFILPARRCMHKIKNKNEDRHDHLLLFCLL